MENYKPEQFIQIDEDAYKTITFSEETQVTPEFIKGLEWMTIEAKIDWYIEQGYFSFDEIKTYVEKKKLPFYIVEKKKEE